LGTTTNIGGFGASNKESRKKWYSISADAILTAKDYVIPPNQLCNKHFFVRYLLFKYFCLAKTSSVYLAVDVATFLVLYEY